MLSQDNCHATAWKTSPFVVKKGKRAGICSRPPYLEIILLLEKCFYIKKTVDAFLMSAHFAQLLR